MGLLRPVEKPLKRFRLHTRAQPTPLKRGVNETGSGGNQRPVEKRGVNEGGSGGAWARKLIEVFGIAPLGLSVTTFLVLVSGFPDIAPVQGDKPDGVLPSQFNEVTIRDRLRRLHKRRQVCHAEVVGNELKSNL